MNLHIGICGRGILLGELVLTMGPLTPIGPTEFGLFGKLVGKTLSLLVDEGVEGRFECGRW